MSDTAPMPRGDTRSIEIDHPPEEVFDFIADVSNWPTFSPFAERVEKLDDTHWVIHSPQGATELETLFDRATLRLDHRVKVPSGDSVVIFYGVAPNGNGGSLLTMTNFKAESDTDEAYAEQLEWTERELANAKKVLEERGGETWEDPVQWPALEEKLRAILAEQLANPQRDAGVGEKTTPDQVLVRFIERSDGPEPVVSFIYLAPVDLVAASGPAVERIHELVASYFPGVPVLVGAAMLNEIEMLE